MENLLSLSAAVVALMSTPGPVTLASAAFGASHGLRAFPHIAAMTAGTVTIMVAVALGITGLMASLPGAAPMIAALAGAYILYLAYRIATAPPAGALAADIALPPLIGVYAMAVANPKAWGAMGALFSGYPLLADPVAGAALKVVLLTGAALAINIGWMLGGSALAGMMRSPRASRALNLGFSLLLVASVAAMLLL